MGNCTEQIKQAPWPVPSKQPVRLLEEKPPGSSSPPRLPGSLPHQQEESRSPTDTGQEPLLSVRSGDTRSPLSSSSASCPSSAWSVRSPRTSRLTSASRALPSWPSRRPARLTSSVCLRTPTCAPSTPSVSPSCPRTSSWPGGSVESVHKKDHSGLTWQSLTTLGTPCGPSVTVHLAC